MSIADLIPMILATRHEVQRVNVPLTEAQKRERNRRHNKKRDEWRAKRRAKGLPYT